MCLGVSWYLANDMQFHCLAPLALIPFALKRKRIAFLVITIFILIGIISTPAIMVAYPNMVIGIGNGLSVSRLDSSQV